MRRGTGTQLRSQLLYGGASLINAAGTGFYYPFIIPLFSRVLSISPVATGAIVAITTLASVPFIPFVGEVLDRLGGKMGTMACFVIRGASLIVVLAFPSIPVFVVANTLIMLCARVELSAVPMLAAEASGQDGKLSTWLALSRATFATGYGVGALGAGVLLGLARVPVELAGYFNAFSFLGAAALCAFLRTGVARPRSSPDTPPKSRSTARFIALALIAAVTSAAGLLLESTIAPYVLANPAAPRWLPGALLALNCVIVATLVLPLASWFAARSQARVVAGACALISIGLGTVALQSGVSEAAPVTVLLVAGMLAYSLGELGTSQVLGVLLTRLAPADSRGRHLSFVQLVSALVASVVPLAAGALIEYKSGIVWALTIALPILCLGLFLSPSLRRPLDKPEEAVV